ncbi:MAG: C2 family cysteine protease, partial [Chloroflexota bacterium]
MLHHPNNRQIFLRNFTQTDEGVRVRTNNWTKGPSHGIQHKFSNQDMANVDVDFEEQDRTGKYVKVFYDTNDAKDIEGYVNHRLVVTNPKPNPTIHQMPNALAQGLTTHYRGNTGALFPTPPTSDEAKQGLLGDCFLISAVATIVAQNATHITNMMIDHGNRVTVRFYENGKPVYIVVDKNTTEFVSTVGGGPAPYQTAGGTSLDSPYAQGPLWIQLLEKAYAIFKRQTYQELNNGGRSHYAFEEILNTNATRRELTARELNLRSIPKNQLPWLNYDPPKKQRELRGKQQGLFLDIFNSHPTKIQIWSTFVDQNTVGGETLDSIQEELRTAALPAGIIDDVMRYLARQDWYSGYSGSKLYGIKDMKVFEDITERLASGELVTAASQKFTDHTGTSIPTKREVHGGHMYSVFGTRDRGGILEIEIRNPWGSGGVQYQLGPPRDYSQELEMLEQPNPSGRYWIELSHFVDTYD